jgi:hypothetical protein
VVEFVAFVALVALVAFVAFVAVVALVALVAVAALPEIAIFQVPDAPVPVGLGTLVPITRPKLERAPEASEAPVPPSATAKSVMPVIEPPVIDTLFAACVAIVPRPRLVRAVEALAKSDRLLARKA